MPLKYQDMAHRRGQFNMAHALAAHLGLGHFDAALVAHHALKARALIFSTVALPVLGRPEDALAEQSVALGFEGAIVDGFGFLHFSVRPLADFLRRGQPDLYGVQIRKFKQGASLPSILDKSYPVQSPSAAGRFPCRRFVGVKSRRRPGPDRRRPVPSRRSRSRRPRPRPRRQRPPARAWAPIRP